MNCSVSFGAELLTLESLQGMAKRVYAQLPCERRLSSNTEFIRYETQPSARAWQSTVPISLVRTAGPSFDPKTIMAPEDSGIDQRLLDLFADYRVGYKINDHLHGVTVGEKDFKLAPELVEYVLSRHLSYGEKYDLTIFDVVSEFNRAFDWVPAISKGTSLFRGIQLRLNQVDEFLEQKTTGKRLTSTSTTFSVVDEFGGLRSGSGANLFTVLIKYTVVGDSVKGIGISSAGKDGKSLREVVLRPDTQQRVREFHYFDTEENGLVAFIAMDLY